MNPLDSELKRPPPSEPRMPPPRDPPPVIGRKASGASDQGLNGVDVVCVLEPVVLPICVPLVVPDVVPDVAPVLENELPSPAIGTPSCTNVCSVCSGMPRERAAAANCCSRAGDAEAGLPIGEILLVEARQQSRRRVAGAV